MARHDRLHSEPTGEVRMSLSLRFAAGSHEGMIRGHNEDSGYAGPRLLAIADGMGGQAAGEVASSEVISTIVPLDDDVPGSDILTSLGTAVQRANDQLRAMVQEDPQLEGMGTTLTALLWTGQRLGLVHVGDSRAYLLRDGVLTQITQDHTWVQRLVDEGRITEEEATTHPQRSLLMRALGSSEHVEPDLSIREVRAGDRYLICSDGLSGVVSHQTMEETLASYQGPQETVQELIQLALRGGGPDNITVIVADVLDLDQGDTLAGQLSDQPVVVGAVAENQHHLQDNGIMQTPAGRAAHLGRRGQGGGEFGPPGSGDDGYLPAGEYGDEDFAKQRKPRRWLKTSLYGALALAVVGGGLYGGYRWTQTQYYVGTKDEHVALYRGISQDLAWVSLSEVEKDHPEIELKYLPPYQQKQVKATIAEGGLQAARTKVEELAVQASACRKQAERKAADQAARDAKNDQGKTTGADKGSGTAGATGTGGTTGTGTGAGTGTGTGTTAGTGTHTAFSQDPAAPVVALTQVSLVTKATPAPNPSASKTSPATPSKAPSTTPSATPSPGPTLSEDEQKVVSLCGKQ